MSDLGLELNDWLATLREEYLGGFLREGGASVKVAVVATPEAGAAVSERVLAEARDQGFWAAGVDAGLCKVHLLHNLFFEVARQIEWDVLARDFLRAELEAAGFRLPGGDSLDAGTVALVNDQHLTVVRQELRMALTRGLMRDPGLSRQFRLGALAICQAELQPDELRRELAQHVLSWLRGELPRIGPLRDAFIYQRIDRHTARTMLLSTSAFIRKTGRQGLVVVVNVSRYSLPKPIDDGRNRYSKAAALDMWETLREFVDGTDDMQGAMFVFVTGPEFLEDEERGLRSYSALHLRMTDDVRDRRHPNPLAPLVRIAEAGVC
ncbi:MAG TPA: BREX system ATP-binding domain-containing protein [Candidatus Dormibacteraeota bacterium]|jgi:hypothetical protein|nr:BREX system ATP-binding domain-containing protein [Candidatus Dormibacteraeota bacterium]